MKRFLGTLRLCLLVLCMFAPAVAHALPSGYTRLEYVESTDTAAKAYIDTGLTYNSGYLYDITFSKGGLNNSIMGVRLSSTYSAKGNFSITYANNNTAVYSSTSSASTAAIFGDTTFGVKHNIQYQQSTRKLMFDGRSYWKSEWITSLDIPYNVYLFAFNIAGSPSGSRTNYARIYSYKVRNANGVLIQNFVPVKNASGVVGFYDLSDSNPATAFHKNKGSGSFVAGPEVGIKIATKAYNDAEFESVQTALTNARTTVSNVVSGTISQSASIGTLARGKQNRPTTDCPDYRQCMLVQDANNQPQWFPIIDPFYDLFKPMIAQNFYINIHGSHSDMGYTQLDYIQSNGTQYIDTGATLNTNTDDVEIVFQAVSNDIANVNMNLFGARATTTSNAYTLGVYGGGWRFGWGNSSPSAGTANTDKHTAKIEHENGVLRIDDGVIATRGSASITTPTTATLFAIQTNGGTPIYYGTFKIYSYKKWTNNTLIHNFIPVRRNSDDALGMYDTVSGTFFGKSGTGGDNFTYGATVANTDVPAAPVWSVIIRGNEDGNTTHVAGTVYGTAKCNSVSAVANDVATSANLQSSSWTTAGNNCWCSLTQVDTNGNAGVQENPAWVFNATDSTCSAQCATLCRNSFIDGTNGAFRSALSGIQ